MPNRLFLVGNGHLGEKRPRLAEAAWSEFGVIRKRHNPDPPVRGHGQRIEDVFDRGILQFQVDFRVSGSADAETSKPGGCDKFV